ncbi:glycosyltransferase family 2 protein [bacterium]|nr:glycosyltransferase family 2 protein [bacterium]
MRKELTAVILTKEEGARVERCVSSLSQFSKLIIIDTFSTDETFEQVRMAWKQLGRASHDLMFLSREWKGFTDARNFSLRWVRTEWVLWIDADEWIESDLDLELSRVKFSELQGDVYSIARKSFYLGQWVRFGGWYPDFKRRLGRVGAIEWKRGPRNADVHENLFSIEKRGEVARMDGHFGHEPFKDKREHRETNWRYSSLLAEGLASQYHRGEKRVYSYPEVFIKVLVKFFENYVLKLGFLDGRVGFLIARGSAQSLFWRLTKARKLFKQWKAL